MADTKVGGVYIEIQARMGKLESDLKQVEARLQRTDNTGQKLSATLSSMGSFLAAGGIATGLFNIGKSALVASANMEQQRVAFTTMLGSAEKAQTLLNQMQDFAASTPFQFNEIVDAGKRMIAFGFDASEVTDRLRMLGDVSAGLGAPLGDMVYLFGQIKTQGRAMTQDLMQFANRGVPIYDELAKVLGVNVSQVKEFASQGKIGFAEIDQVFKNLTAEGGRFAGLMEAQSKTLAGRWSNFNDQLDRTLVTLGDKMAPAAGTWLDLANNILGSLNKNGQQTETTFTKISDRIAGILVPIKGLFDYSTWIADLANKYLFTLDETEKKEQELAQAEKDRWDARHRDAKAIQDSYKKEKEVTKEQAAAWRSKVKEAQKFSELLEKQANEPSGEVEKIEQEIEETKKKYEENQKLHSKGLIDKQQYENNIYNLADIRVKKELELEKAKFEQVKGIYSTGVGAVTAITGQIADLASMYSSNQTTRIEQDAEKRIDILNAEYENQVAIIEASAATDEEKAARKKALDEQLARDEKAINDKAEKDKRKAQRESAKISKQLAIFDTLITTPQAAMDAYASLAKIPFVGPALGAAAAVATTALGLAKLKLIQDQPLPALAQGGIVPATPGGLQFTAGEAGSSEAVIPLNDATLNRLGQAMARYSGSSGVTNIYLDSELIYSSLYEASKKGIVKIDQRAVVA